MQQSVKQVKRVLRKQLSAALAAVPADVIASESETVTSYLLTSPTFTASTNLSIYISTPSGEIQTDGLIRHSLEAGKRVYVPFCPIEDKTVMRMLRLRDLQHFESLLPNRWGIREIDPKDAATCEDADDSSSDGLDVILVPGLAFDRSGQRLGHGRGYYDRYLTATESYPDRYKKRPPQTVALALREQMLPPGEEVPVESWDQKPDFIVTPDGFLQAEADDKAA